MRGFAHEREVCGCAGGCADSSGDAGEETRLSTVEAPIHDNIKRFIVENDERGTNLIFRRFKNTGRVAKNSVSDQVVEISQRPDAVFEDIRPLVAGAKGRVALETGDIDAGLVWAGQVQGLIHDIPTCAALISRIMAEAEAIITRRLATMAGVRDFA